MSGSKLKAILDKSCLSRAVELKLSAVAVVGCAVKKRGRKGEEKALYEQRQGRRQATALCGPSNELQVNVVQARLR